MDIQLIYEFTLIDNNLFASESGDNTIRIWNTTSNSRKYILTGHSLDVPGLKMVSSDTLADLMITLLNSGI